MPIPWKSWGRKAWDLAVSLIRATAPDKGQADPPPDKDDAEALWDRWKGRKP